MGLFDFLKVSVSDKNKKASGAKGPARSMSCIEFDNKSFPLAALTTKGFVATGFDGSLVKGQNARLAIKVDDAAGRFSFPATVTVADVQGEKLIGEFQILPPELEQTIRKYGQLRKQKAPAR